MGEGGHREGVLRSNRRLQQWVVANLVREKQGLNGTLVAYREDGTAPSTAWAAAAFLESATATRHAFTHLRSGFRPILLPHPV